MDILNDNKGKSADKGGLSGKFMGLFRRQPEAGRIEGNDFTAEKEAIADYQAALQNEKKAGRAPQAGPGADPKPPAEQDPPAPDRPETVHREDSAPAPAPDAAPAPEPAPAEAPPAKPSAKLGSALDRWHAPKLIKTNLIKGEASTFIDWKKYIFTLILVTVLSAGIIGAVYVGLLLWEKTVIAQSQTLEEDIRELDAQIKEKEGQLDEIKQFQDKLDSAAGLLDRHVYWTGFFAFLEDNLIPSVNIVGAFSGNTEGTYTLALQGGEYADITDQIKVFKDNPLVLQAQASGATKSESKEEGGASSVSFSIQLTVDKKVFFKE